MAQNQKRVAIGLVRDELEDIQRDLGTSAAMVPSKAEQLTEGLGGSGSVWQSEVAQTYHDELVVVLEDAAWEVNAVVSRAGEAFDGEPVQVDDDDKALRHRWLADHPGIVGWAVVSHVFG